MVFDYLFTVSYVYILDFEFDSCVFHSCVFDSGSNFTLESNFRSDFPQNLPKRAQYEPLRGLNRSKLHFYGSL